MKYSFGPESLIQRVEVVRTEAGAKRAYFEAAPNADRSKLMAVRDALAKHGYITVPIEVGGKSLLEVRKFTDAESLLKQLTDVGAVKGVPSQSAAVTDRVGLWDWIKNNTYKACLGMYIIGDIGFNIYTHLRTRFTNAHLDPYLLEERKAFKLKQFPPGKTDRFDEFSGYGYTAGTFVSAVSTYLRGDQSDEEVYDISKKIRDKMVDEGVEKSSTTFKAIEDDKSLGVLQRIKQGFIRYPSEILNMCYGAAGFFMVLTNIKSNIPNAKTKIDILEKDLLSSASHHSNSVEHELLQKQLKSSKGALKVYKQDIVLGSITLASGMLATLIKEKPKTPDEPEPQGPIAKAWRWLQEKPLRIAAGGYLVSTSIHVGSTTRDYMRISEDMKTAQSMMGSTNTAYQALGKQKLALAQREFKFTHGRMLFCITNIIAEVLMALSSKGHGDGVKSDATVENSATAIAAESIALQAPEKREELIEKMSHHLASPKVMGGSSAIIMGNIRENLKSLARNPWTDAANDAHHAQAQQAAAR